MLITGCDEYPVEKYKDYKGRTMGKHIDKIDSQLWAIKSCSLKKEDKEKLRQQLLEKVQSFKF